MKFLKAFFGVRDGEIYPTTFAEGDECPPELEAAAIELGACEPEPPQPPEPPESPQAMEEPSQPAEAAQAKPAGAKKGKGGNDGTTDA